MRKWTATGAAIAVIALQGSSARAQESATDVARRDLIAQAEAAAAGGDHARAAELAGRAAQLRVTPTIQYFLAREHLALDHPVEALGYAGACARAAEADPSLRNRDGILQACREIVTTSERRVGRVNVQVPAPTPPNLAVRVGQVELPATLYGVPYPVALGAVVIEASAPGMRPFRREVQVTAGQTASINVLLETAPVTPVTPVVQAPTAPPVAVAPVRVAVTPPVEAPSPGPGAGPWIVAGGGAAMLVLGGVFYGLASGAQSDRDAACVGGCVPEAQSHDTRYADFLTATNVSLGIGAAALVGGAVWFLVGRAGHQDQRRSTLRWNVAPTSGGFTLGAGARF